MHPLLLHRGAWVTFAVLALPVIQAQIGPAPTPPAQSTAPTSWNGRYTNRSVAVDINALESGPVLGTLQFDGQSYPFVVSSSGNKLVGNVLINTDVTTFEATRDGDILRCVIGGTALELKRVA